MTLRPPKITFLSNKRARLTVIKVQVMSKLLKHNIARKRQAQHHLFSKKMAYQT